MSFIAILGSHRDISLAELESVYGHESITPLGKDTCLVEERPKLEKLGGTIKVAKVVKTIPRSQAANIQSDIQTVLLEYGSKLSGKMHFGISVYGQKSNPRELQKLGLSTKKYLRTSNISVRLVPNKSQILNAAQVLHNKLSSTNGYELLIVYANNHVYLARTEQVQDIDSYAQRDRQKPVRDSFVGMLPPKLAQIMLNLAHIQPDQTILDPFCGSGTVLIEAALMHAHIVGSDLSQDMVDAARKNVSWIYTEILGLPAPNTNEIITLGDAQTTQWPDVDTIVAETYLGPPMRENPTLAELQKIQAEVLDLHINFLRNAAAQLKKGTYICLAVPMWRINNKNHYLKLVDYLEELGYNRVSFAYVSTELEYYRPQAHVGRQLLTLKRK